MPAPMFRSLPEIADQLDIPLRLIRAHYNRYGRRDTALNHLIAPFPAPDVIIGRVPGWQAKRVPEIERWERDRTPAKTDTDPARYLTIGEIAGYFSMRPDTLRKAIHRATDFPDAPVRICYDRTDNAVTEGWHRDQLTAIRKWLNTTRNVGRDNRPGARPRRVRAKAANLPTI